MDLRSYFKKNSKLQLKLGELEIDHKSIGEGGNSLVFEGKLLENEVAVKFFTNEKGNNKLNRFKAEYLNVIQLENNDGIVKLIAYDEIAIDDKIYPLIIMKRYTGSLKAFKKSLDPDFKKEFFLKLFNFLKSVLKNIHLNGIIHRDIKPENILYLNDEFYLTDFGIAYFNPDHFEYKAHTKNGEKLGNYDFSAPEQSKGDEPHATMDIYAFGQILQWFITDSTHKGTNRKKITDFNSDFEIIDEVIEICLRQDPIERFQKIEDIEDFIENQSSRIKYGSYDYAHLMVNTFRKVLQKTFPDILKGFKILESKQLFDIEYQNSLTIEKERFQLDEDIQQLMENLAQEDFNDSLCFTDGEFEKQNIRIKKGENGIWLIGSENEEIKIASAAIYCNNSYSQREVIILKTEPMQSFNSYPISYAEKSDRDKNKEVVGLIDDVHYVTSEEVENRYAKINGKTIDLKDRKVELRIRHLIPQTLLIYTKYHCAHHTNNFEEIKKFVKKELVKSKKPLSFSKLPWELSNSKFNNDLEKFIDKISESNHRYFEN